jgi:hypothetical protein
MVVTERWIVTLSTDGRLGVRKDSELRDIRRAYLLRSKVENINFIYDSYSDHSFGLDLSSGSTFPPKC